MNITSTTFTYDLVEVYTHNHDIVTQVITYICTTFTYDIVM